MYYGFILTNADDANMITITPVDINKYNLKMSNLTGYAANQNDDIVENTRFYYGDIIIEVLGDFGKASIYEYTNGYKNGQNLFKFDSRDRCT